MTFIVAGRLQDAQGPAHLRVSRRLLVGGGFLLVELDDLADVPLHRFGVIVGIGNGFGYSAPMPVASKWFPDKRGLVVGLMVGGYGAGSAIIGPLATQLIASHRLAHDVPDSRRGVLRHGDDRHGAAEEPAGGLPAAGTGRRRLRGAAASVDMRDARHDQHADVLSALWVAYCLGTTAGQMTISQLVPFMRIGRARRATAAAFAITIAAFGNAGGRILSGGCPIRSAG